MQIKTEEKHWLECKDYYNNNITLIINIRSQH